MRVRRAKVSSLLRGVDFLVLFWFRRWRRPRYTRNEQGTGDEEKDTNFSNGLTLFLPNHPTPNRCCPQVPTTCMANICGLCSKPALKQCAGKRTKKSTPTGLSCSNLLTLPLPSPPQGCLTTYYCSRGCQTEHWTEHKRPCKSAATKPAAAAAPLEKDARLKKEFIERFASVSPNSLHPAMATLTPHPEPVNKL